jgi:hypothetical protein
MMTLIRLELLRVARDRRFWFWSLIGVPVLLPAAVMLLAFAMASFGTVESQPVRPVIATSANDEGFLSLIDAAGLDYERFNESSHVVDAVSQGLHSVGIVDVTMDPGEPLSATLVSLGSGRHLPIYQRVEDTLYEISVGRRNDLMDSLAFDGPSFELLLEPMVLSTQVAPDRLPSGLRQVVTMLWVSLLLFPYLLLTWNGGSRAVSDRLSGYLAPLNACSMSPWKWLVARWSALSVVGGALLLFSAVLFALYMRAYSTVADMLVAEGILQNLSDQASSTARAYLVDAVAMWRDTSLLSLLLWLFVGFFQLSTAVALVVWGSVKAASLAQYRLFEMLPFAVIFVLPLMGFGALGSGITSASWIPGLNTVLSIEHLVSGTMPGVAFFSATGLSLLSNALTVVVFLFLGAMAMRNEKLWAV